MYGLSARRDRDKINEQHVRTYICMHVYSNSASYCTVFVLHLVYMFAGAQRFMLYYATTRVETPLYNVYNRFTNELTLSETPDKKITRTMSAIAMKYCLLTRI